MEEMEAKMEKRVDFVHFYLLPFTWSTLCPYLAPPLPAFPIPFSLFFIFFFTATNPLKTSTNAVHQHIFFFPCIHNKVNENYITVTIQDNAKSVNIMKNIFFHILYKERNVQIQFSVY